MRKMARFDDVQTPEIGGADERACTSTTTRKRSYVQSTTNNGHGSTHFATTTANYNQPQPGTVITKPNAKMKWKNNPYIAASNNEVENSPLTILRNGMNTNDKLAWFEDFERCLRVNGLTQNNRTGCRVRKLLLLDFTSPALTTEIVGRNDCTTAGIQQLLDLLRTRVLSVNARRYELAEICELGRVSREDYLSLQLVGGVFDKHLRTALLNRLDSGLGDLCGMAQSWSRAREFWSQGVPPSINMARGTLALARHYSCDYRTKTQGTVTTRNNKH